MGQVNTKEFGSLDEMDWNNWKLRSYRTRRPRRTNLLTLPEEIRLKIYEYLSPKERQSLRLVHSTFTNEIDEFLGSTRLVHLRDTKPTQAIEFYGRSVIPALDIIESCILKFENVIYKPNRLHALRIFTDGIVTSEFFNDLLLNCTNLKTLGCSGSIKGTLPEGPILNLPELKSLHLDAGDMASSFMLDSYLSAFLNILKGQPFDLNSVMAFWNNQLNLLKRLNCPSLQDAILVLYTCENFLMEDDDEIDLAYDLLNFLKRHPNCKSYRIFHGKQLVEQTFQYEHSISYYKSLNSIKHYQQGEPTLPEVDLQITEFTFASKLTHDHPESKLETWILELLKKLKHLEVLKLKVTTGRPLHWRELSEIILKNAKTLKHLEVTAKFQGQIDFNVFRQCGELKTLKLKHKYKYWSYYPSIVIENFGPHAGMRENLEELILQNVGLHFEDFESLSKLKKLKQLALNRWKCAEEFHGMTLQGVRNLVGMESIESLLFPLSLTHFHPIEWEFVDEYADQVLKPYFYPDKKYLFGQTRYICMTRNESSGRSARDDDDSKNDDSSDSSGESGGGGESLKHLWTKTEWGFKICCGSFSLPKISNQIKM